MAVSAGTMLDFMYWCWRNDPAGRLSYEEAASAYNQHQRERESRMSTTAAKLEITLSPTSEFYNVPVNKVLVPSRIWEGKTGGGIPIEAYIVSIVPTDGDPKQYEAEVMPHLQRSRDAFVVDHKPSLQLAMAYIDQVAVILDRLELTTEQIALLETAVRKMVEPPIEFNARH